MSPTAGAGQESTSPESPATGIGAEAPAAHPGAGEQPGTVAPEPGEQSGTAAPEPGERPGTAAPEPGEQPGTTAPIPGEQPGTAAPTATELLGRARRDARESLTRWHPRAVVGRSSYRQRLLGAAVLATAVSGMFGGLQAVPGRADLPQVAAGQPIDTPQWQLTVEKVQQYRPDAFAPTLRISEPGRHWLVVVTTMKVSAGEPMSPAAGDGAAAQAAVTLPAEPGLRSANPDRVLSVGDATLDPTLQPGLPVQVAFFWEQQDSATAPAGGSAQPGAAAEVTARVEVNSKERRRWVSNGELLWSDPAAKAVVVTPVRPFPAEG